MDSHLGLTAEERAVLQALTRSRHSRAGEVRRARLIMMLDAGVSWSDISEQLPCAPDFIGRWKGRFETERLGGLYARHRGRAPANDMAQLEARVLAWKTWSRESALWSSVWFRPHAEVFCYFVCTGLVRRQAYFPALQLASDIGHQFLASRYRLAPQVFMVGVTLHRTVNGAAQVLNCHSVLDRILIHCLGHESSVRLPAGSA